VDFLFYALGFTANVTYTAEKKRGYLTRITGFISLYFEHHMETKVIRYTNS